MADHHAHSHADDDPHGDAHGDDPHGDEHESHGSTGLYMSVFAALCVLTAISFGSYYAFHAMPKVSWAVMMAVSCMKALLVIMFFMHLLWEANWKYVLTFPAMFMSIFLVLMLVPDVGRRMHYYNFNRMIYAAEPAGFGSGHSHPETGEHEAADAKHDDGKHDDGKHDEKAVEKAVDEKPAEEKPSAEKPADTKPTDEKPEGQKQDAGRDAS